MRRILKWTFWLLLLGGGAYVAYVAFWPQKKSEALTVVPADAAVVIQTQDPLGAWEEIRESALWQHLIQHPDMGALDSAAQSVDSLVTENSTLFGLVGDSPLTLSFHRVSPTDWDVIFIADLAKGTRLTLLSTILKPIIRTMGYRLTDYDHNGHEILKLVDAEAAAEPPLMLSVRNNLLILSYSDVVLHNALDQPKKTALGQRPGYEKVTGKLRSGGQFVIYLPGDNLQNFLRIYSKDDFLADLGSTLDFSGLTFRLSGEQLELDGTMALVDTGTSYLHAALESGTGTRRAHQVAPLRTSLYTGIQFGNYPELLQTFEANLKSSLGDDYDSYMKDKARVEKFLKVDIERDFLGWVGEEIALVHAVNRRNPLIEDQLVFLHAPDIDQARAGMGRITGGLQRRKLAPVKFKPIAYRSHTLYKFHVKGFFKLLFGKFFKDFDTPYFAYLTDHVVFANNAETLQHYLDDYDNADFLADDAAFEDFSAQFDRTGNAFVYINLGRFFPQLGNYLDADDWLDMRTNVAYWLAFRHIGLHITGKGEGYALRSRILYNTEDVRDFDLYAGVKAQNEAKQAHDTTPAETPLDEEENFIEPDAEGYVDLPNGYYNPTYADGSPQVRAYVLDNRFEGDYRDYYRNGLLRSNGEYRNGKKVGDWYYYTRKGKLKEKVTYK